MSDKEWADKRRAGLQESERIRFNTDALRRIRSAFEIAVLIQGPAWNQQAAVALTRLILDATEGQLDGQLAELRRKVSGQ